ncbi:hypothetical protein M404DRAFT_994907 [Pisolithus tinctorius Marx 270]|uniref:Uncharacterized protein n=1 Tax=Pisolithus tinctorius Marx 270 TaxID=870435 RepID=A0A0C3PRK1_PISTI|nr:hypothetical protein M404DRAFT_994907 [Pisolithus tinctorius Marx 270]
MRVHFNVDLIQSRHYSSAKNDKTDHGVCTHVPRVRDALILLSLRRVPFCVHNPEYGGQSLLFTIAEPTRTKT